MKLEYHSINEWVYPDSEIKNERPGAILHCARGGDACFQILTDTTAKPCTKVEYSAEFEGRGLCLSLFELGPVAVPLNSAATKHTTTDYEAVKDFVTRRAPFNVFDITFPVKDTLRGGRVAFLVRVDVESDAAVGKHTGILNITVGKSCAKINIEVNVYGTVLNKPKDSPYSMVHWIYPASVARMHGVARESDEIYNIFKEYFKQEIDMRNTHFQLPTLLPVKDENGNIVDFDTTENERLGALALQAGFKCIYGGFVAHWNIWNEPELFLVWDRSQNADAPEGVKQLCLYFKRIREMIVRCGWQDVYMQGLVDEPQVASSITYRALCGLFRKCVPSIKIIDPVETPDIHASCDIHVIKQACYDKDIEAYEKLRETSDELWVYTCGYPAGKWMNHALDLPLNATRLTVWQGVRYNMTGFLHWGYNGYHESMDTMKDTCYPRVYHGEPTTHPAGNHALIYGDKNGFYESVRAHVRRLSAQDGELLLRLKQKDSAACDSLINTVCKSFLEYTADGEKVDSAHKKLLELCDKFEV